MADCWMIDVSPSLAASRGVKFGAVSSKLHHNAKFITIGSKVHFSGGSIKQGKSAWNYGVLGCSRRNLTVKASSSSSSQIAPLQFESPIGQFLSQILVSHPHLLPAAVDQQLLQLQTDREAEIQKEETPATTTDLVLYKRIAEVKANERKRALEEILYTLIVQKFIDANVPLVPAIAQLSNPSMGNNQEDKIQKLHSTEAYEMIQNHLSLILGNRLENSNTMAVISKLRVGQVYAASIMYGYFLKRVDQRFQLEKTMKTLPWSSKDGEKPSEEAPAASSPPQFPGLAPKQSSSARMRSYVMSLDPETLQSYATIRSKEAFSIIEKHTEALFGRPEIVITPQGSIDASKDEVLKISFSGLQRLVLEAVTFGSFLWDVESYVDTRYHFVAS